MRTDCRKTRVEQGVRKLFILARDDVSLIWIVMEVAVRFCMCFQERYNRIRLNKACEKTNEHSINVSY